MRMSTKGRFAVTAMIDVAMHEKLGPVPLSDISVRHHISLSYLEQMFSKMRQKGLVKSTRGTNGGYMLGRQIDEITIEDIIFAVDDTPQTKPQSTVSSHDTAQDLWDTMNAQLLDFMQSITLRSLVPDELAQSV